MDTHSTTNRRHFPAIMRKAGSTGFSAALTCLLLTTSLSFSQTYSRLSSRFLARGEQALLEVCIPGVEPEAAPLIPSVKDVSIQSTGFGAQPRFMAGRRLEYVFPYIVSSYEIGRHEIPSFEIKVNGVKTKTEPMVFEVFDTNNLQWSEEMVGGRRLTYAARFCTLSDQPYEGETVPVEIKVYVPRQLAVEDWGIPEFERDGVASWRFEPTDMQGQVVLLGTPYTSVSYPSTLSATRTGKVGIGPATVRLITRQIIMDGYARPSQEQVFLKIPKLEMEARPLPSGAPDGFENAVGTFSIQASTTDKEIREGDPISVDIAVTGRGNFDTLHAPALLDSTGWKLYDATPNQRGDERRQLEGAVNFRQFLRPLEMKSTIPPFRLVYFDPDTETYKTLLSQALPLKMLPSAAPKAGPATAPPALPVPVESMTDILSNIPIKNLLASPSKTLPPWTVHAVGGLLSLILILKILWASLSKKLAKNPQTKIKLQSLQTLAQTQDDMAFLKAAGAFIERHMGQPKTAEIMEILTERDHRCFQAEKSPQALPPSRRNEILGILKKAVLSCVCFAALCLPQAKATDLAEKAQSSYEQAKYEEAIQQWLSAGKFENLSAATLYNIGNACYRIGSPGQAALYYRRALLQEPDHKEAAQNLRFIERKYGAITIQKTDYQSMIQKIPLSVWQGSFWAAAWLILISLLIFPATRSGAKLRLAATGGLVAAPLLLGVAAVGWHYFPDEARFGPLNRQAVIVAEKSVLYTDAARTSSAVLETPQGSLCNIIRQSGDWVYISFSAKTRGWIPAENIEKLIPDQKQGVPKVRKPKADPNNA